MDELKRKRDSKEESEMLLERMGELRRLKRERWLAEFGLDEKDVLMEQNGTEIIMVENSMMDDNPDDFEGKEYKKVELPLELQKNYIPF